MAYGSLIEPEKTSQVAIMLGAKEKMSWKSTMKRTSRSMGELERFRMRYLGTWTVQECKTRGQQLKSAGTKRGICSFICAATLPLPTHV